MFEDFKARKWDLGITWEKISRVKDQLDFDCLELDDDNMMLMSAVKLRQDTRMLCTVIANLLQDEIKQAGISETEFGEGMLGVTLDYARYEFEDQIVNFMQNPERDLNQNEMIRRREMEKRQVKMTVDNLQSKRMEDTIDTTMNALEKKFWKDVDSLVSQIQENEHLVKSK